MTKIEATVLVIEDEPEIKKFLTAMLITHDYKAILADTAKEGIRMATLHKPDVLILDLGLPDTNGSEVIGTVRGWSMLPIIVLSARGQEEDKVKALELGADDYLTKPFSAPELLARLKVALRHARQSAQAAPLPVFDNNGLYVDLDKRQVRVQGKEVRLTPTEYRLLTVLVRHADKVVTHSQLLKEVWDRHTDEDNHSLRIAIQHLRRKLGDDPMQPRYIMTEPGVGYRLTA
jgi:two-component system, OmpR family, KDP operon response regulator KdpE